MRVRRQFETSLSVRSFAQFNRWFAQLCESYLRESSGKHRCHMMAPRNFIPKPLCNQEFGLTSILVRSRKHTVCRRMSTDATCCTNQARLDLCGCCVALPSVRIDNGQTAPSVRCCCASTCMCQRMVPYAVWMGLYTIDRVNTGSIVSDIGIGYRPCHFLDIGSSKN